MSNRVEHQKRDQPAIEKWPFCFSFGVQLGFEQKQALIIINKKRKDKNNTCSSPRSFCQSQSGPVIAEGRAEQQRRNLAATSQWRVGFVFGFQPDCSCRLKSVPSGAEKGCPPSFLIII